MGICMLQLENSVATQPMQLKAMQQEGKDAAEIQRESPAEGHPPLQVCVGSRKKLQTTRGPMYQTSTDSQHRAVLIY